MANMTMYTPEPNYLSATGPLAIRLTNDYFFRVLLQTSNQTLKGLTASLLHLSLSDVRSVEITNPIRLGTRIDQKTFILDIRICLNNHDIINLELQVINEHNWQNRSLAYLCREFDQLTRGNDYNSIHPVHQIGILDFTLFPYYPEFFSTYKFMNVKTHYVYSDNINLHVLDLTQIQNATLEDQEFHIDYWAKLLKSETWEDLKSMAHNNEITNETLSTIYELFQEDDVRRECEAREEYYRKERQRLEALNEIDELKSLLAKKQAELQTQVDTLRTEKQKATAEADYLKDLLRKHNIDF